MIQTDSKEQRNHSNSLKNKFIRVNVNSKLLPQDFFPRTASQSPKRILSPGKSTAGKNPNSP